MFNGFKKKFIMNYNSNNRFSGMKTKHLPGLPHCLMLCVIFIASGIFTCKKAGQSEAQNEELAKHLALLNDKEHSWRASYVWLVEHPEQSRPALRNRIRQKQLDNDRHIEILGWINNEQDIDLLAEIFLEANPHSSPDAAVALGRMSAPESGEILLNALQSKNQDLIKYAIWGLVQKGDSMSPHIEKLQSHPNSIVRHHSQKGVEALKKRPEKAEFSLPPIRLNSDNPLP